MSKDTSLFGDVQRDYKYTKRLSKSKLLSFMNCPKQFKLMNDYPNESKPGPALIKGIKVHDMFDKLYENGRQYNNKEDIIFELNRISPNEYDEYKMPFANWQEEMGFPKVESTEEKIYDKEDDIVIKYDRIDYDGTTRILWDYKTGKLKAAIDHEFELMLYAYYYMKATRKKVHYVGIYFADHGISDLIKVTDDKISRMLTQTYQEISNIKEYENINTFPAKPSFTCKWCSWNHLCDTYLKKKNGK